MPNVPPVPDRFVCNRAGLRLSGRTYDKGEEIPGDVVAGIPRASSLLSRRWIIPDPDTHGKTPAHVPQPTPMAASTRSKHRKEA